MIVLLYRLNVLDIIKWLLMFYAYPAADVAVRQRWHPSQLEADEWVQCQHVEAYQCQWQGAPLQVPLPAQGR